MGDDQLLRFPPSIRQFDLLLLFFFLGQCDSLDLDWDGSSLQMLSRLALLSYTSNEAGCNLQSEPSGCVKYFVTSQILIESYCLVQEPLSPICQDAQFHP